MQKEGHTSNRSNKVWGWKVSEVVRALDALLAFTLPDVYRCVQAYTQNANVPNADSLGAVLAGCWMIAWLVRKYTVHNHAVAVTVAAHIPVCMLASCECKPYAHETVVWLTAMTFASCLVW